MSVASPLWLLSGKCLGCLPSCSASVQVVCLVRHLSLTAACPPGISCLTWLHRLNAQRRYSTPDQEPVVDISISNARHCLYIVGMETVGGCWVCDYWSSGTRVASSTKSRPVGSELATTRPPRLAACEAYRCFAAPLALTSTAASHLPMQITVADLSGTPFMRVSTLTWRGVVPEGEAVGPTDVGAFRWVLL